MISTDFMISKLTDFSQDVQDFTECWIPRFLMRSKENKGNPMMVKRKVDGTMDKSSVN